MNLLFRFLRLRETGSLRSRRNDDSCSYPTLDITFTALEPTQEKGLGQNVCTRPQESPATNAKHHHECKGPPRAPLPASSEACNPSTPGYAPRAYPKQRSQRNQLLRYSPLVALHFHRSHRKKLLPNVRADCTCKDCTCASDFTCAKRRKRHATRRLHLELQLAFASRLYLGFQV